MRPFVELSQDQAGLLHQRSLRSRPAAVDHPTACRNAATHDRRSRPVELLVLLVVDGLTAVDEGLPGKPDPAMFQHAADRLGVPLGWMLWNWPERLPGDRPHDVNRSRTFIKMVDTLLS